MSADVTAIRDSVVNKLKTAMGNGSLKPALQAQAIYDLAWNLQQLAGGQLVVMPQTKSPQLANRAANQKDEVKIDVAVQYKYATPAATEVDPYLSMAEGIADLFLGHNLDVGPTCLEASFPHGLFLQEHVKEFGVFTSVVTLTFLYTS